MSKGTLNQVTIVGNLGADPESRTNPQGNVVTVLRIATTRTFKDQQGQYVDQTDWHRVVSYGNRAKYLRDYARKGSKILVNGRLSTRKWQDKEGKDQFVTEVIAEDAQILDKRPETHGSSYRSDQQSPSKPPAQGGANGSDSDFDDDIPF